MFSLTFVGALLCLLGLASTGLYFARLNLSLLWWIDRWGLTAGWVIRATFVVLGLALLLIGRKRARARRAGGD